ADETGHQPSLETRAFADDVAAVTPDLFVSAPALLSIFTDCGRISGLQLNLPKTCVVPLFRSDQATVLRDVLSSYPSRCCAQVAWRAIYLSFLLGPERGCETYDKALDKVLGRASWVGAAGGGLYMTTMAYTVCITSALGFFMQLDALPPSWASVETEMFRRLVLAPVYGRAPAAQLRVAAPEKGAAGGLQAAARAVELHRARVDSGKLMVKAAWADWLDCSYLCQLDDNA
ncbi:unnamed protein product, partial [Prorocentrum cordatum]